MFATASAILAASLVTDLHSNTEQGAENDADAVSATSAILLAQGAEATEGNRELCDLAQLLADSFNHDELCAAWRRVGFVERRSERNPNLIRTLMVLDVAVHMRERSGRW